MALTDEYREKFFALCVAAEPENITHDGELPYNSPEVKAKRKELGRKWVELQHEVGRKVTSDEIWDWELNKRR